MLKNSKTLNYKVNNGRNIKNRRINETSVLGKMERNNFFNY